MKFIMHVYFMFRNFNMHQKIISVCMVIIVISATLTGVFIYKASSEALEEKVNDHVKEVLEQSTKFTDEKLKSMLIQVHFMQTTEKFNMGLRELYSHNNDSYAYYFTIFEPLLTQIKIKDTYIKSIKLITPYGLMCDFTNRYKRDEDMLKDYEQAMNYVNHYGDKGLIHWGNSEESWEEGTIPILLTVSASELENKKDNIMHMFLNLDKKAFEKYIYKMGEQINGWVLILDKNNRLVFESETGIYNRFNGELNEVDSDSGTKYVENNREEYLMNWSHFSINNWKMICIQSEKSMLEDLNFIKTYTVVSVLLVILSISVFAIYMANSIAKPMRKLKNLMERSPREGFTPRFNSVYNDEVGQLGKSFDAMSEKIQALITELEGDKVRIKEEQLHKRKAELKALQAQINPHFLYNALDSIYWKSVVKGNQDVGDMAIALSNLFRTGLNKGKEGTTIEKEIEHVKSYLQIQKIIYEDLFDFSITIDDPSLLEYPVLKLILQPLVENSILHGFKDFESKGIIQIRVKDHEECVTLSVLDNGRGFKVQELFDIDEKELALKNNYDGYALGNVLQRLKLTYDDRCNVEINSQENKGTIISITVPKRCDF